MNNIDNIRKNIGKYALKIYGKELEDCTTNEKYTVLSESIMEEILPLWVDSKNKFKDKKQAYYFSAEFLMARALSNNLINLGYIDDIKFLLDEMGIEFKVIPYEGANEALTAVVSGEVDFAVTHASLAKEFVKAGDISPVIAFSDKKLVDEVYNLESVGEHGYDTWITNI